jgi:histidyl-tRNA synthetase
MKKQMNYAHQRGIPFVALVGEQEIREGILTLREMDSGSQEKLTTDELLERLSPAK